MKQTLTMRLVLRNCMVNVSQNSLNEVSITELHGQCESKRSE